MFPMSENRDGEVEYIGWSVALIMFTLLGTLIPVIGFMVANIGDVMSVTQGMYLCTSFSIAIAIYLWLLFNRAKILKYFQDIECMVNESELQCSGSSSYFVLFKCISFRRIPSEWTQFVRQTRYKNKNVHDWHCIHFDAVLSLGCYETVY